MARNAARLKMGYYPLPESEAARLRALLSFTGPASVVDPCVGQGMALEIITQGADVRRYGVELDAERALIAQSKGIETIQGNAFDAVAKPESFSLLYLNPPYDSEIGQVANNRMERLFLDHTYRWLAMDGVLAMVIPFERLMDCAGLLSSHFTALNVFRMTDEESRRFRQIAVLGVRSNVRGSAIDANKRLLQRIGLYGSYQGLPELAPDACEPYPVPPSGETVLSYRGLPYDLLEEHHRYCFVLACTRLGAFRSYSQYVPASAKHNGPCGAAHFDHAAQGASGAGAGDYAHSANGVWWVQPLADQAFTKIQPDSTWRNSTHLGTEYAALLVEPGYQPAPKTLALPKEGKGVVDVSTAKGTGAMPFNATKVVHFSGYDWNVQTVASQRGGEWNNYDPANVWTDQKGYLHLQMGPRNGQWTCAEVNLTRSLGYGSYRFVVQDTAHLAPSAMMGIYTWDEAGSQSSHNEIDIELSRWGNPGAQNAQYVIQPFYVPQNVVRFMEPAGVVSHQIRWEPGTMTFKTTRGEVESRGGKAFSEHVFTVGVPSPATETIHIDLYDFHHSKNAVQHPAEVVIEKFEYLP